MKRATSVFCIFLMLCISVLAQQAAHRRPAAPKDAAMVQTPKPAPTGPTLEDGTPVKLRISQTVSSADAHVGQTVDFEVLEEVKVNDVVVVPKGGVAWATVTVAESKKRMGRGGKLDMNIDSVRLVDGEKVALRAVQGREGRWSCGRDDRRDGRDWDRVLPGGSAVPVHAWKRHHHPERD